MNIILLLAALFLNSVCFANRQQENFLQAQHCAEQQQYQEAVVLYDTLPAASTVVLYNKGVCLYQLGKYLEAFVNLYQALHYADRKQYSIVDTALRHVADKAGYVLVPSWKDTIRVIHLYVPLLLFQILFLLTLFFTTWYCSTRSFLLKRLLLLILCCLQGGYLAAVWYNDRCKEGIIVAQTQVYTGPGKEYKAHASFEIGRVVSVDKKEKSWYKVKGATVSGWIEETAVNMIEK